MKTVILSQFGLATLAIAFAPIALAQGQQQAVAPASRSFAGQATRAQFERGYYFQKHEGNLAEAAAAFEQVAADGTAPATLRAEAKTRLAECREDLVSADLARLMSPDALAYVEFNHPGEHVTRLLKMLGLVRAAEVEAGKTGGSALGNGLFLPDDFTISPALVAELKKMGGVAAMLSGLDQHGQPDGLIVLHPGSSDLLRGLLETAIQVLEPAEPIEGFKTYRDPSNGWITVTARLFLIARSREQLTAAVARLHDPQAESLGSRQDFQAWRQDRQRALLFSYVNGRQLVLQFGPKLRGQDARIANTVLDLEHFDSIVAMLGTDDDGVSLRTQITLKPGHHNLAYAMIRTAPLSRRSLAAVPPGAAAVAMIGLNPPSADADHGPSNSTASVMDIGREVFANIEEITLFALPSAGAGAKRPTPEIGLVFAVKDAAKSEALWNQLLVLPTLLGAPGVQAVREVTIEGQGGRVYQFPNAPPVVVVRTAANDLVVGTEGAVAESLKALAAKNAIRSDASFAALLDRLTPSSSKALLLDAGRAVQMATAMSGEDNREMIMAGMLLKDLKVSLVTDETPTQFGFTVQATGLPNVPAISKQSAAPHHPSAHEPRSARRLGNEPQPAFPRISRCACGCKRAWEA
jgi:hypothetical protein